MHTGKIREGLRGVEEGGQKLVNTNVIKPQIGAPWNSGQNHEPTTKGFWENIKDPGFSSTFVKQRLG